MAGTRKQHTAAFKATVALAALKGDRTVDELAGQHGVHPTLIHGWKKHLLEGAEAVSADGGNVAAAAQAARAELFEQIGRLEMELGWLQKKRGSGGLGGCGRWSSLGPSRIPWRYTPVLTSRRRRGYARNGNPRPLGLTPP